MNFHAERIGRDGLSSIRRVEWLMAAHLVDMHGEQALGITELQIRKYVRVVDAERSLRWSHVGSAVEELIRTERDRMEHAH